MTYKITDLQQRFPALIPEAALRSSYVPAGWYGLLYNLCLKLEEMEAKIEVEQIKVKYGSLCFYYKMEGFSTRPELLIQAAEAAAMFICKRCGTTQYMENSSLCTLCQNYAEDNCI